MTARAVHGRLLFREEVDHQVYLRELAAVVRRRRWTVFSWCHMPNHVHLLLRTEQTDLALGIKTVHERFATYVNERYEEYGHVFGDRFHNRVVTDDRHFVATLRYIARNPVAAGLCPSAASWPWGAHRALAGLDRPPAFLAVTDALGSLASDQAAQRAVYVELVTGGDRELVRRLAGEDPSDAWLVAAVDEHRIRIPVIAAALGVGRSTLYRRLAGARAVGDR